MSETLSLCPLDPGDPPKPVISRTEVASRRQYPHLVAAADWSAGEFDGLRLVLFEDQPEGTALGQRGDLRLEVRTELRIYLLRLPEQLG